MKQRLEEGLEKGLEKDRLEGRRETASRLLAMGLPVERIAEATGLTEEEIVSLRG